MRPKVVAGILGLVLAIGGLGGVIYAVVRMTSTGSSDCVGDECLNDASILALPAGIVALVFGLIIGSWALGSLREERGSRGPTRVFGFMTGLGAVFLVMGVLFLGTGRGAIDDDGSMLFVGALFGVMGLIFIGVDLVRFRGELRKDRLRVSGLHGTARVVDVRDTNVTVNNSPMVKLDLEVTLPGQAPFRAQKRTVISRLSVGAMAPGATIPVLADPKNPKSIVLDWDAGTTSPAVDRWGMAGNAGIAPWLAGGSRGWQGAGGPINAEVLRNVSAALARAAERAEQGGASVTHTPDGTTVINANAGTVMTVNGRAVPAAEMPTVLAGLPAQLAAIFGAGATGAKFPIPDVAPPATAGAGFSAASAASAASDGSSGGPSSGSHGTPGAAPSTVAGSALGPSSVGSVPSLGSMPSGAPHASPFASTSVGPIMQISSLGGPSAGASPGGDIPLPGAASVGDGLPARVSLDAIQDTGVDIAGNRLYTFDLTVSVAGRQPYQMKHAAVVPRAQVARLTRGASFPAQVDPNQPGQIVIAWDH